MYELLAAQLPFSGSTMSALRKAICRGEYAPLPAYISPSCRRAHFHQACQSQLSLRGALQG